MKLRTLLLILIVLTNLALTAQQKIKPTDSFRILGKIKEEKSFSLAELDTFAKKVIADQTIRNHAGEAKGSIKNLKGVLLTTLLTETDFVFDKPKTLNEFYFVFIASDGYKVVFSYNEIYNTEIGNNLYIVTEMDGHPLKDIEQRIQLISTLDLKNGRRYIKGLERIEVKQAQ